MERLTGFEDFFSQPDTVQRLFKRKPKVRLGVVEMVKASLALPDQLTFNFSEGYKDLYKIDFMFPFNFTF